MLKRMSVLILCIAICLAMSVTTAFADADKVEFSLSVSEGNVGDTVKVSVSISENSYFTNAMLLLHYDNTAVSFVTDSELGGKVSSASNTMIMSNDFTKDGYVKCAYIAVRSIKKAGTLLTFDFTVLDNKPAVFSLEFEECMGEDDSGNELHLDYVTTGCILNDDGSLTAPSVDSEKTTVVAAKTTTTTKKNDTGTTVSKANDPSGNNTDISDEQEGSVGDIAIPGKATATAFNGTTQATNAEGEVSDNETGEMNGTTTLPDSQKPIGGQNSNDDNNVDGDGENGVVVGIVVIALCVVIAAAVAIVAMKLRKKNQATTDAEQATEENVEE